MSGVLARIAGIAIPDVRSPYTCAYAVSNALHVR
jgi:hypothetical protein